MSERAARLALTLLVASLLAGSLAVDLPELTRGEFWSDGATYYAMAQSLAFDHDLRYEARDVLRVRREFAAGPQGIFLKRSSGGLRLDPEAGFPWMSRVPKDAPRIYFAKAFAYPVAVAPFVRALGTRGLLFANAVFLGLALLLGYGEARRRCGPGPALALTLAVFLAGVTPLYLLWLQPEIFNLALVTAALAAWSSGRPLVSAVLFGIATYAKPTHVFLALPLGVAPLLAGPANALLRGLGESLRRGAALLLTAAALYGLNAAVTGEVNYQGGERKTFYDRFPFETHGVSFGNSGEWMTTDRLGPLVEGEDEERNRGEGPPLAREELRDAFLANLGYFWWGRYAGVLPYFFPVALAAALFLAAGPRDRDGHLALASLVVSYLFYIWMIPANWYGGGGAVGNRYFLSLVPLGLWLAPRGREWIVAGLGGVVSFAFVGPILLSPVDSSLHPGRHGVRQPFKLLPAELTMLNDLSFNVEHRRKKLPFGDMGDLRKNWPAHPKAYWIYFPDDGTYGKETKDGVEGVRVRPAQRAELILRAQEPVRRLEFRASGGVAGDELRIRVGAGEGSIVLPAEGESGATIEAGPGLLYYDSFVLPVRLESRLGGGARPASEAEARERGPFVRIEVEVEKRAGRPRR